MVFRRRFRRFGGKRRRVNLRSPFRRKRTSFVARRTTFRRRARATKRAIPATGSARMSVLFKSCNRLLFTSGTSKTLAILQLTPNNLLDPWGDASSTVQPLGWDQWNNFFLRYRAIKIHLTLDWAKEISPAAHNLPAIVGHHITQQTGEIADTDTFQAVCDLPRTRWKYMPSNDDTSATQRVRQTVSISPRALYKATDVRNFDTTTSAAPTNLAFLQLFVGDGTNAALTNTTTFMSCLVTMRITGFFHDRTQLPISVI